MSTPSPAHDPLCLKVVNSRRNPNPCSCFAIAHARSEERAAYQETWKANLPLIAARHFRDGYSAALAGDPLPEWALAEPPPRSR